MDLKSIIRDVPDFPTKGILFRDITPLLAHPSAMRWVLDQLLQRYRGVPVDKIVAIESRGFIFGAPLAYELGIGFVPARKMGKLPFDTIQESYDLEYGTNTLCMHVDAIMPGERVVVLDDLIATGGTFAATCKLVERLGGTVREAAAIIELGILKGREALGGRPFYSMVQY